MSKVQIIFFAEDEPGQRLSAGNRIIDVISTKRSYQNTVPGGPDK